MTINGTASAAHDAIHQMPPCPSSADNKPNTIKAASTTGQRQMAQEA
jgi:hypothetical protein